MTAAASAGLLLLGGGLATAWAAWKRRPPVIVGPSRAMRRRTRRDRAVRDAVSLAAAMARPGAGLDRRRMEALHQVLLTRVRRGDLAWAAQVIRSALAHDPPIDACIASLRAQPDPAHRALAVHIVCVVAAAGEPSLRELRFVRRVAAGVGVSIDEVEAWLRGAPLRT